MSKEMIIKWRKPIVEPADGQRVVTARKDSQFENATYGSDSGQFISDNMEFYDADSIDAWIPLDEMLATIP